MCQIMGISTTTEKIEDLINYYGDPIVKTLSQKGGDYYSVVITYNGKRVVLTDTNDNNFLEALEYFADNTDFDDVDFIDASLLFFSRQAPEMENLGDVQEQPYIQEDGRIVAIHGTIYNDEELADKYNFGVEVDTEVFNYLDFNHKEIKGNYTAIEMDSDGRFTIRDNGLGYWESAITGGSNDEHLGDMIATTDVNFQDLNLVFSKVEKYSKERTLFAAFSGGMDIAFSVAEALSTGKYKKAVLNYFNWGSNASQKEIETLAGFKRLYEDLYDVEVQIEFIQAKEYFKAFFDINQAQVKINDPDAVGDANETEAPIAYVPYRNTQFVTMLASIAETDKMEFVDIVLGLNLSEGMVFMDNAEPWLKAVNQMVKYGGSDFQVTGTYNVIAPFFERTKTNMLKEFKEKHGEDQFKTILEQSFSCYYPKDGEPCGECGSCILRNKALKRI